MSFNKIYSGMENAPQAIDENFNNSYPKDEILTEETAAALGVTEDNPTPEMAFKKITEGATGIAMLSKAGAENIDTGNFPLESGKLKLSSEQVEIGTRYDYWVRSGGFYMFSLYGDITKKAGGNNDDIVQITGFPFNPKRYQTGSIDFGSAVSFGKVDGWITSQHPVLSLLKGGKYVYYKDLEDGESYSLVIKAILAIEE